MSLALRHALLDDIHTPRLVLRLIGDEVMAACLAGDIGRAERLLGVAIPSELPYVRTRLAEDWQYRPWSMRAIILPHSARMIGHVRFHSRPDPEYLRSYARGAVEFGYHVFREYRRRGYATEAVMAVNGVGASIVWRLALHRIGIPRQSAFTPVDRATRICPGWHAVGRD
jgi:[ribosomal protein S5]-alanine N-acetyltransferase